MLQDEYFEIVSGVMTVLYEGKVTKLKAGEKITLPKNVGHNHYNNEDEPLVYKHTMVPGLDFDYFFETLAGLGSDKKLVKSKSSIFQEMVTMKYIDSKAYLADMPIGLQKGLMVALAPIGRMLGYRAVYKKYSGVEK